MKPSSLSCGKHALEVSHVCRLKSCSRRFLCAECLKEPHGAEHEASVEAIGEFVQSQSRPGAELLAGLEARFGELQQGLSAYQQQVGQNSKTLDADVALIEKTFADIANTAKLYLKKNLREDLASLQNRLGALQSECKTLREKAGKALSAPPALSKGGADLARTVGELVAANAEVNHLLGQAGELGRQLARSAGDRVTYKINKNAEEVLLELNNVFTAFMLKFFKRFKMLLVRPSLEPKFNSQLGLIRQKLAAEFSLGGQQPDLTWVNQTLDQPGSSRDNSLANALDDSHDRARRALPGPPDAPRVLDCYVQTDKRIVGERALVLPPHAQAWVEVQGQFVDRAQQISVHQSFLDVRARRAVLLEDGSVYEGEWDHTDARTGKGRCLFADGSYYDGFWLKGAPNTLGRFIFPNGELYEGMVESGRPQGKGVMLGPGGYKYVGFWRDGAREGQAEETVPGKFVYAGAFLRNKHHGAGRLSFANGMRYEGEFFEGKFNGEGVFTWPSGEKYLGGWFNNKKHGRGKYFYEDGKVYSGDFADDVPNGFGQLASPDGETLEGFWKNGNPVGMALKTQDRHKVAVFWDDGDHTPATESDQPFA